VNNYSNLKIMNSGKNSLAGGVYRWSRTHAKKRPYPMVKNLGAITEKPNE
jgi:hypothetical protein